MEKFSAYRDPATGIQPFLVPVPHAGLNALTRISLPLRYALAVIRIAIILTFITLYALVNGVCLFLTPLGPLHRFITRILTTILARSTLFVLGFYWISVEKVTRKRGKGSTQTKSWSPKPGDLIISNWVSWIEILWLATVYDPTFVIPVADSPQLAPNHSTPITHTPGRRTGTGSANIQSSQARITTTRQSIKGFYQVSLLRMIRMTGQVPSSLPAHLTSRRPLSIDDIREKARRPIVVFPECTTSNGRGLLRFANVFNKDIPIKDFKVFIMSVRYDPPTDLSPTISHSIPSIMLNPLPHFWAISTSLMPLSITIRLLNSNESPSSPLFVASEILTGSADEDQLAEASAALISQVGRLKRTGMGWEDKHSFLEFYGLKR